MSDCILHSGFIAPKTKDECILFSGFVTKAGYGQRWCRVTRSYVVAHRAEWIEHRGLIPHTVLVLHTCEVLYPRGDLTNRRCINLDHLYLGSHKDNTRRMMELRRNRHGDVPLPGELNGNHILTDKEVLAIRELYLAGGVTQVSIADAFGVSKGTINHVVKGRSWKHLL